VLEVHEGVRRPELQPQLVAGDQLAGMRQQGGQQLQGLALHVDLLAGPPQLAGAEIQLEIAKPHGAVRGQPGHLLRAACP
jgi:hypothetical protein